MSSGESVLCRVWAFVTVLPAAQDDKPSDGHVHACMHMHVFRSWVADIIVLTTGHKQTARKVQD
jgi:hypothetical protein